MWDAARHSERRQGAAAIAVCEIFLREPGGWEMKGEPPKSCSYKPSPGQPLCSPTLTALGVHVKGCAPMLCLDNVFLPCVWTSSAEQCLELYKFTEKKKKSGESQADTDGCERNFKMPFNIAVPPSGIEEFAPCFFSFPGVLWGVIQSRPVPLTQLTLLQPDRLSSPQGDGNSSRRDCPTWGAAPAALCTIPCT